ncbi:hypothetical protein FISHEDRAFT_71483 [Fistulina hepatica ATCC 64428]|uniref:Uncharacterized protein n=1 Tax=Fistulina hepatica ATCC 64428 TaxID=1128425 RepID=A0A0D7AG72_9AGAR|nr:hypothetical protein FISHEDRAFT_71483 [Fistulina hepatica ATCC 64428]
MTVEATLDNTLGATFIGIVISTILFGITVLQSYLYFADGSAGDPIFLKIFVAVMLAIDAFHVALLCHLYYYYTVSNFGNLIALAAAVWSMDIQIGVGVLLSTMVQWFYAWRIYKLSNQKDFISPIAVVRPNGSF